MFSVSGFVVDALPPLPNRRVSLPAGTFFSSFHLFFRVPSLGDRWHPWGRYGVPPLFFSVRDAVTQFLCGFHPPPLEDKLGVARLPLAVSQQYFFFFLDSRGCLLFPFSLFFSFMATSRLFCRCVKILRTPFFFPCCEGFFCGLLVRSFGVFFSRRSPFSCCSLWADYLSEWAPPPPQSVFSLLSHADLFPLSSGFFRFCTDYYLASPRVHDQSMAMATYSDAFDLGAPI